MADRGLSPQVGSGAEPQGMRVSAVECIDLTPGCCLELTAEDRPGARIRFACRLSRADLGVSRLRLGARGAGPSEARARARRRASGAAQRRRLDLIRPNSATQRGSAR